MDSESPAIENTKIGKLVQEAFTYLFSHKLISDEDLQNLMQIEYSREHLGCAYPTIVDKKEDTFETVIISVGIILVIVLAFVLFFKFRTRNI